MFSLKPILAIFLGGKKSRFNNQAALESWFESFEELKIIAEVDAALIPARGQVEEVQKIIMTARRLKRDWAKYSGFVIITNDNTCLYQANLLHRLTSQVGKPIVFTTGATQVSTSENIYSDMLLMANIINATQAATSQAAGVMIVGGQELVPVEIASIKKAGDQTSFTGKPKKNYGRIDFGIQLTSKAQQLQDAPLALIIEHEDKIIYVRDNDIEQAIKQITDIKQKKGIVIEVSEDVAMSAANYLPADIPVLLITSNNAFLYFQEQLSSLKVATPHAAAALFTTVIGSSNDTLVAIKEFTDLLL